MSCQCYFWRMCRCSKQLLLRYGESTEYLFTKNSARGTNVHIPGGVCVCVEILPTHATSDPPDQSGAPGHPSRKWAPVNKASGRRAAYLILDVTTNRSPADRTTWSPHRLPRTFAVHRTCGRCDAVLSADWLLIEGMRSWLLGLFVEKKKIKGE